MVFKLQQQGHMTSPGVSAGGGGHVLDVCFRFGQDGQQERGRLVGIEGGRNDQVVPRRQRQHLHHLAAVLVHLRLGHRSGSLEERRWKLPTVGLKLEHRKSKNRTRWTRRSQRSSRGECVACVCDQGT